MFTDEKKASHDNHDSSSVSLIQVCLWRREILFVGVDINHCSSNLSVDLCVALTNELLLDSQKS